MTENFICDVQSSVSRFTKWFEKFGETSYDHQSYYAGPFGGKAKAFYYRQPVFGILAVSPMVFSEAFFPFARRLFWKKQRLPIADAHYAMGYAFLHKLTGKNRYYRRAIHFLDTLERTRCPDHKNYSWGYPFDWVTRTGIVKMGTPLITTTPYAYEAFLHVYEIDHDDRWKKILQSIANHTLHDIKDFKFSVDSSASGYSPLDSAGGVINASAYRAFLLTNAYIIFSEEKYRIAAERNINFVLQTQKPNGSWPYHAADQRDFVDHFHTCFVLKALAKIQKLTDHPGCTAAIEKGISYYVENLFNEQGLPKPFSRRPRLTVYKHELYDYAECINLCVLLRNRFEELDRILKIVLDDVLLRWQKSDGSYRSRKLLLGWDNVPMHRWAQSQLFRSLAFYLSTTQHNGTNALRCVPIKRL